jgi:hypothetical protein
MTARAARKTVSAEERVVVEQLVRVTRTVDALSELGWLEGSRSEINPQQRHSSF